MDYIFEPNVDLAAANALVVEHHYSGRKAGAPRFVGGLRGPDGALVAACFFSQPPTRWSEPVVELSRLVRLPGSRPPLTFLISQCVKAMAATGVADLAVSFADNTQNHHGGVYQAASWNFHEMRRPSCDGFILDDGRFIPRRTANATIGTSSATKAVAIYAEQGIVAVPHFDKGKYLYWKPVTKRGAKKAQRLGLKSTAYPKPLI